ncbi:hypothetical protein [Anaerofustis butyriciformans]|uniref:hypothetical protein n=1 Tax=Anaerofustis butyriciformans TaxID=3108533 RepID=UPI002E356764|nr:hypothetical protein [Anaerofustis sp. HA2171]
MKQEQLKNGIIPKKPFYKKWWFIALVVIVVIGAIVGGTTTPQDTTNSTPKQDTTTSTKEDNKYKTELEWALDSNYMIKVEDSSFDGDVIKAGKYRFYPNNVSSFEKGEMIKEGTPIVWDIYISKNEYKNNNELKEDEYVGSVGGLEKDELTINVEKGDYIYINYNETADKGLGTLKIEMVE